MFVCGLHNSCNEMFQGNRGSVGSEILFVDFFHVTTVRVDHNVAYSGSTLWHRRARAPHASETQIKTTTQHHGDTVTEPRPAPCPAPYTVPWYPRDNTQPIGGTNTRLKWLVGGCCTVSASQPRPWNLQTSPQNLHVLLYLIQ